MNDRAKGLANEGSKDNGGTQTVTWARGTRSDTVEVEVKDDSYRSDCNRFSGG